MIRIQSKLCNFSMELKLLILKKYIKIKKKVSTLITQVIIIYSEEAFTLLKNLSTPIITVIHKP